MHLSCGGDGDDLRVPFRRQHFEHWQLHLLLVVPETRYQTMAHLPARIRPLPAHTGTRMDTFQNRVMQRCRMRPHMNRHVTYACKHTSRRLERDDATTR